MSLSQIAAALHLHHRTIASWVDMLHYEPRKKVPRPSVLDPFKGEVTRLLDTHAFSAQQIFQRLRENNYAGGYSTVKKYVRLIRPKHRPAFLTLVFAPGEAAQDWTATRTTAKAVPQIFSRSHHKGGRFVSMERTQTGFILTGFGQRNACGFDQAFNGYVFL